MCVAVGLGRQAIRLLMLLLEFLNDLDAAKISIKIWPWQFHKLGGSAKRDAAQPTDRLQNPPKSLASNFRDEVSNIAAPTLVIQRQSIVAQCVFSDPKICAFYQLQRARPCARALPTIKATHALQSSVGAEDGFFDSGTRYSLAVIHGRQPTEILL